ncbi:MAG: type II toxin-antitoxin system VapC family toxin [Deltaproteobacteria bacterium]|nr:type II toxin-antitoxin system VapC family toxin [Deltaproteobacteria bacterium]
MNALLLDTQVFLWWRANDRRINKSTRLMIGDAPIVYVSAASAWEAGIKAALGRLSLPEPFQKGVVDSEFVPLAIGFSHAEEAARLPFHHADPFDRMLVAQARIERLRLVTHDGRIRPYDVDVVWV